MNMNDIPAKRRNRYPCPRMVRLSREDDELLEKMQTMHGREASDFLRMCVQRGLDEVFPDRAKALHKKTG